MDQDSSVLTGREVLIGVTILFTVVIFCFSIRLSRRLRDPTRSAFLYLRVALGLFLLSRILDLAAFVASNVGGSSPSASDARAIFGLSAADMLVMQLTDVLVLILLFHLCKGISLAHLNELSAVDKLIGRCIPFLGAALSMIAVASVATAISYYTISRSSPSYGLSLAFQICLCIASLLVSAWAIQIKLKSRGVAHINQASIFLLACCFLYIVTAMYGLLMATNPAPGFRPSYLNIVDIIFSAWPDLIILCLVFIMSAKKRPNGLWSTVQPNSTTQATEHNDTPWTKNSVSPQYSLSPTFMMYDPQTGRSWEVKTPQMQDQTNKPVIQELEEVSSPPPQEMYASPPELQSPPQPCTPIAEIPTEPIMLPNTVAGTSRHMHRDEQQDEGTTTHPRPGQIGYIKLALRRGMEHF